AQKLAGEDPDHSTKDLFNAIEQGEYPSWTVSVQIMTPEQAKTYHFDPFDVTKVWYHADFPLIEVGTMTLNKNPENFFAEVEQAAFAPSTLIPGIYPSPDKLLQGRLFAYEDAHRYRLGVNHDSIPVNSPKHASFFTNERDGKMNIDSNHGSAPNYYPNSTGNTKPLNKDADIPPIVLEDSKYSRKLNPVTDTDYEQTTALYERVLSEDDRKALISNIAGHLGGAEERIQYRQVAVFSKASEDYGKRLADALSLDFNRVKELAKLSDEDRAAVTAK
ncbi:MAG: catalase, partial [Clostridiales Family XIII bacterium]|nr:catalase [Clostridiales Family XIII bacterium]